MTFQKVQQTPLSKVFANYQTCLLTNKVDRNRKKVRIHGFFIELFSFVQTQHDKNTIIQLYFYT